MTLRRTAPVVLAVLAAACLAWLDLAGRPPAPAPGPAPEDGPAVRFVPLGPESGVTGATVCGDHPRRTILEFNGTGVGLLDYDGDGWLDIYVVDGGRLAIDSGGTDVDPQAPPVVTGWRSRTHELYRNLGNGRFAEVAAQAGVAGPAEAPGLWGQGVAVADVDGDGDEDIFQTNLGPDRLYLNRGDGTFEDAAPRLGLADPRWSASAAFFDLEGDGDLDLAVARYLDVDLEVLNDYLRTGCGWKGLSVGCGPQGYAAEACGLYRNDGPAGFTDVSATAGMVPPTEGYCLGILPVDLQDDGDLDLYVSVDVGPNLLYLNEAGTLLEAAETWGLSLNNAGHTQSGMGVDAADLNADGLPDLFVANFSEQSNSLYLSGPDSGLYRDATYTAGLADESSWRGLAWGSRFLDYDHDGHLDLLVAQGHLYGNIGDLGDQDWTWAQPKLLYRGLAGPRFEESGAEAGLGALPNASSRGLAVGDLDNDGDLDWVETVIDGPPRVWINRGAERRPWATFRLRGLRSNRDGIGTRLAVTTGLDSAAPLRQTRWVTRAGSFQSSSDVRAHFGLAGAERIDRLEVSWPSGLHQVFHDLPARRHYRLVEGESEPTWTEPAPGW